MITKEIIFVIGILIWLSIGFFDVLRAKDNRIHYNLIIFLVLAPCIPLFAKICGLI